MFFGNNDYAPPWAVAAGFALAMSRKREYLADASGVGITRYPESLASALEMIQQNSKMKVNKAVSHLYFSNPFSSNSLFSTHPPLEKRIARLREI